MSQDYKDDCIFCQIVSGQVPCFKVYEDERSLAFADINPLIPGHTLVIPKAHFANLMEMSPGDLAAVHQASQKVARAILKATGMPGLVVMQLNGRAANQVVMHYHIHLVPRDKDKDGLNLAQWEPMPGDMKAIEAMAEKIRASL